LEGKALIVTGSSGIGAATAALAASRGAKVLHTAGETVTGWELATKTGGEVWIGDLHAPGSAESIVSQCLSRFGRVDGLFNVAGLSGRRFGDGPVHECTDEGWEITLVQNLRVTFQMCRAATARMLVQKPDGMGSRGAIVNMGSVLAESPEPLHFANHAYTAAKGGVIALSLAMASYYAPHGIRVNALSPGMVRTPVSQGAELDARLQELMEKKQPLSGGMIDADDVARAAVFLLSDDARSITGEVLGVDGGWKVSGR
jgi:NAD(P)-dependent dehydrogenase (short-subunit alcohol dehydrogenase family)